MQRGRHRQAIRLGSKVTVHWGHRCVVAMATMDSNTSCCCCSHGFAVQWGWREGGRKRGEGGGQTEGQEVRDYIPSPPPPPPPYSRCSSQPQGPLRRSQFCFLQNRTAQTRGAFITLPPSTRAHASSGRPVERQTQSVIGLTATQGGMSEPCSHGLPLSSG